MAELETLGKEYYELLAQQQFKEEELDYSVLERHKPFLDKLAQVSNSGVTVSDICRKEHVYTSYNFLEIFGYDLEAISQQNNDYFNSRVHPDDFVQLLRGATAIMQFYFKLPKVERPDYKFVNEYRVLGSNGQYVRVVEQHQALELDKQGNVWLALGVIDISPDQSGLQGVHCQIFNYKTGKMASLPLTPTTSDLSKREIEILQLVKEGLLSKEISNKLFISVHTVNTHRQRILEKLGVNNSHEAIAYAASLGLIH